MIKTNNLVNMSTYSTPTIYLPRRHNPSLLIQITCLSTKRSLILYSSELSLTAATIRNTFCFPQCPQHCLVFFQASCCLQHCFVVLTRKWYSRRPLVGNILMFIYLDVCAYFSLALDKSLCEFPKMQPKHKYFIFIRYALWLDIQV